MQIESLPVAIEFDRVDPLRRLLAVPLADPAAPGPSDRPVAAVERVHQQLVAVRRARRLGDVDRRGLTLPSAADLVRGELGDEAMVVEGARPYARAVAERDGPQLERRSFAPLHPLDPQGRIGIAIAVQVGDLRRRGPAGLLLRGLILERHVPEDAARAARDASQPLHRRCPGIWRGDGAAGRRLEERVAVEHQHVRRIARPEDPRLGPLHAGIAVRLEAQGDRTRRPEESPVAPGEGLDGQGYRLPADRRRIVAGSLHDDVGRAVAVQVTGWRIGGQLVGAPGLVAEPEQSRVEHGLPQHAAVAPGAGDGGAAARLIDGRIAGLVQSQVTLR